MHECPDCGMVCTCDSDDLWQEPPMVCTCCSGDEPEEDDDWFDPDDTSDELT